MLDFIIFRHLCYSSIKNCIIQRMTRIHCLNELTNYALFFLDCEDVFPYNHPRFLQCARTMTKCLSFELIPQKENSRGQIRERAVYETTTQRIKHVGYIFRPTSRECFSVNSGTALLKPNFHGLKILTVISVGSKNDLNTLSGGRIWCWRRQSNRSNKD